MDSFTQMGFMVGLHIGKSATAMSRLICYIVYISFGPDFQFNFCLHADDDDDDGDDDDDDDDNDNDAYQEWCWGWIAGLGIGILLAGERSETW